MPIIAFCEECGEKFTIAEDRLVGRTIEIVCPVCSEITCLSEDDVKVLSDSN